MTATPIDERLTYHLPQNGPEYAYLSVRARRREVILHGGWILPAWAALAGASLWLPHVALPPSFAALYAGALLLMLGGYSAARWGAVRMAATLATVGFTYALVQILVVTVQIDRAGTLLVCATLGGVVLTMFWYALDLLRLASAAGITAIPASVVGIWLTRQIGATQPMPGWALIGLWLVSALAIVALAHIAARSVRGLHTQLGEAQFHVMNAEILEDLKDAFVASTNHELRTPFMALLGYIDILQREWRDLPPALIETILIEAERVSRQLRRLLNAILKVREVQGLENFTPNVVPLAPTLRSALAEVQVTTQEQEDYQGHTNPQGREIRLAIPDDLAIWGEATYLTQILTNLLTNAIKYSPDGSPIDVSAALLVPRGHVVRAMVEIRVRDYGLGIPPDQIHALFARFVRLSRDIASADRKGTGLGLWLCQEYVRAMGGKIWVESSGIEGEGSTFYVQLPTAPSSAGVLL
jgi:signal transduction histidine kinase